MCVAVVGIGCILSDAQVLATSSYADATRVSTRTVLVHRPHGGATVRHRVLVGFVDTAGHPQRCELTAGSLRSHYRIAYSPSDPSACGPPPSLESDVAATVIGTFVFLLAGVLELLRAYWARRRPFAP
jgi:hypothetical protein